MWNFLGIYSKNREEWAIADIACMKSSTTIVPFYDSLGMDALSLVINQTELITMCIEKSQIDNLLNVKQTKSPTLKNLIIFDEIEESEKEKGRAHGVTIYNFKDILKAGEEHHHIVLKEPQPETIYMFCYTSGTTGDAKGAKITHEGFVADMYFYENAGI